MSRTDEKHLFTLRHIKSGGNHKVLMWKGYGVVVPTLWTTNGDFAYTARLITNGLDLGRYVVVGSSFRPGFDFNNYVLLKDEFINLYRNWKNNVESKPPLSEPTP